VEEGDEAREGDRWIPSLAGKRSRDDIYQVRNDKKRVGARSEEEIATEERRCLAMTRENRDRVIREISELPVTKPLSI
jgi:hypothetical protein